MVGLREADDRKRPQAVIRRGVKLLQPTIRLGIRSGICQQHHKTVEELVEEADDTVHQCYVQ